MLFSNIIVVLIFEWDRFCCFFTTRFRILGSVRDRL